MAEAKELVRAEERKAALRLILQLGKYDGEAVVNKLSEKGWPFLVLAICVRDLNNSQKLKLKERKQLDRL